MRIALALLLVPSIALAEAPERSWTVGLLGAMTYDLAGGGAIDTKTYGPAAAVFLLGDAVQARAGARIGSMQTIDSCTSSPCSHNSEVEVTVAAGGVAWLGSDSSAWRAGPGLRIESGYASGTVQRGTAVDTWSGVPVALTASLFIAYRRAFVIEPSLGQGVAFFGTCSAGCTALNRTQLALSLGYGF